MKSNFAVKVSSFSFVFEWNDFIATAKEFGQTRFKKIKLTISSDIRHKHCNTPSNECRSIPHVPLSPFSQRSRQKNQQTKTIHSSRRNDNFPAVKR
jgi:hypothetical protein